MYSQYMYLYAHGLLVLAIIVCVCNVIAGICKPSLYAKLRSPSALFCSLAVPIGLCLLGLPVMISALVFIGCLTLGFLCSKPFYKDDVDDWDGL